MPTQFPGEHPCSGPRTRTPARHPRFTRPQYRERMSDEIADDDVSRVQPPPTIARTGAVATVGLSLDPDRVVPRKQIRSWALWDWATQPFNSVILTFIFTALYLTTEAFLPADVVALG